MALKMPKLFVINLLSTLLVVQFVSVFARSGYVVTTTRKWTAGETNRVCVTLSTPATAEDTLNIGVEHKENKDKDEFILPLKKIIIPEGVKSICNKVSLGDTKHSSGNLVVTGNLGGVKLNYSKPISIANDVIKTFVQTDKFLYKPSQTVQFRILTVVGPFLEVSLDQYEEIYVENPSGTRIAQWLNVTNDNGLIHKSFTLSEEPEEGTYKIIVRPPRHKTVTRTFKVEDYVLPRYEATINPPSYILGTSETFDIEVCAKYTFGQPVKGNVTLSVDNGGWGKYQIVVKKTEKISGCKSITFNSSELSINGRSRFTYNLGINAVVNEEGTGAELKAKVVSVDISRTAISFEDIGIQKFLKPELPYIGEVKTTFPDDSPAVNELMKVCSGSFCKNLATNARGVLKFAIPPHLDNQIVVTAVNHPRISGDKSWRSVMYESKFTKNLKRYHSPSNSSLVVALDEDTLECSNSAEFIEFQLPVRFSAVEQKIASLTVQVVSRGQIQFSNTYDQVLAKGSSLHVDDSLFVEPLRPPVTKGLVRGQFSVPISLPKTVSPKAKIVIWYSRNDNEVVADSRVVDITKCLLNNVDLSWSSGLSEPGDYTTLSLKAEPLSLCSLGVVDKSVHLLSGKKNSLTLDSLLKVTESASVGKHDNSQIDDFKYCREKKTNDDVSTILPPVVLPAIIDKKRRKRSSFHPWSYPHRFYSDDIDALHMFDDAGLYVLSDQTLETRPCIRRFGSRFHNWGYSDSNSNVRIVEDDQLSLNLGVGLRNTVDVKSVNVIEKERSSKNPKEKKRTYFPETWLWNIEYVPESGVNEQELTLPDTVTEWVGSAVCVHPTKGVGLSNTASITTFKDFFADLTLPPTVKRGEIFPVKISVFNYLKQSLPIKVVLEGSPDYEILHEKDFAKDLSVVGSGERSSCVAAEDKVVHSIRIQPKSVGLVNITVVASVDANSLDSCGQTNGKVRSDILIKPIRVEIEGFVKEEPVSKYICTQDLENNEDSTEAITLKPPIGIIPDSARGFVAVFGDLMGPTLENLGNLIKMPYGCGEQNMLNFAPNIFVMQYLDASGINNKDVAEKATKFMEKGYQRELNYRHGDGSFSAFGERDNSGSTWLTAFVLKSFAQARNYISVDAGDLNMSRDWLKRKQMENGCFESVGRILHKGMKGGLAQSDSPALISSFVLISLIEAGESTTGKAVREALFCLNADKVTDNPYSLAVKAYALALADNPAAHDVLKQLLALGKSTHSSLHWTLPKGFESSAGVEVETAGYAVLALLAVKPETPEQSYLSAVRRIIKWINNKRNGQGGFVSTQDTIVALQALAEFEKTQNQGPVDSTVIASINGVDEHFIVNEQNKLLQQTKPINEFPASITYDLVGQGCVLFQALLRYNVPDPELSQAFNLNVTTATEPDRSCKTKRITACASYQLEDKKSNMGIIEVNLVSGYIPDKADLKQVVGYGTGIFKRYEVDGSLVTLYVDEFSAEGICASFKVIREVDVENAKPGSVKVYDYYKPELFVTEKYTLPSTEECATKIDGLNLEKQIIIPFAFE